MGAIPRGLRAGLPILAIAIALRVWDFGNPVIHVDEQYYLLVGDRILHGDWPYIDIWDRKPVGLFLLFAGFRLLPGDGILAYQIAATLFAAGAGWLVWCGARMLGANAFGALAGVAAYLLLLELLNGRGGQAPVFYNPFVAGAAVLTLRLPGLAERRAYGAMLGNGALACLLCGIAIQIKYTAAVEGAFVGCAHLWFLYRAGARPVRVLLSGSVWALAGLFPTLAALAMYCWHGEAAFAAFRFANFASIALRPGYPAGELAMRLLGIGAILAPVAAFAAATVRDSSQDGIVTARRRIAIGWLAAALGGFAAIGTFFDHYALPLAAPFAILAAPAMARQPRAAAVMLAAGVLLYGIERSARPDDAAGARAVARVVERNDRGGCPYVFIGDTVTYLLARACLPTAYAFPNLLAYATERGATGSDEAGEVRRILAGSPPVIVTSDRRLSIWNPASLAILKATLAARYRPIFAAPRGGYRTVVYLRSDLPER